MTLVRKPIVLLEVATPLVGNRGRRGLAGEDGGATARAKPVGSRQIKVELPSWIPVNALEDKNVTRLILTDEEIDKLSFL